MRKLTSAAAVAATIAMSGFFPLPLGRELLAVRDLRALLQRHPDLRRRLDLVELRSDQEPRTGVAPETGAVLVFKKTGVMTRGHVAVVSQVLTDRIVQITHANWSPINGRRGQVERTSP
jgi:hypothetical protein